MLLLIAFTPIILFGQTKKATQVWIKQKIEQFAYNNSLNRSKYLVTFTDAKDRTDNEDWLTIRTDLKNQDTDGFGFMYFPVCKIDRIEFSENGNALELIFYSKDDEKVFKIVNGFSLADGERFSKLSVYLSRDFSASDMQLRFKKAFKRLANLCASSLSKEPY